MPAGRSRAANGDPAGTSTRQPRLVFSIPYRAAFGVFGIPAGKWIPEIYRTVREERGAWSLLKKAPVRATLTAMSPAPGPASGRS